MGIASNIHFTGRCTDVPALLNASYACVLASKAEGFSNSILEYMAAGKPVVATDVGGASEAVIEGTTGYLVPSDDDGAMASSILDLLGDDNKAAAFGREGRRVIAERFTDRAQLRNTLELYGSLLNN
jgi:glycosyltransferase involved in cell wall biosynthesis